MPDSAHDVDVFVFVLLDGCTGCCLIVTMMVLLMMCLVKYAGILAARPLFHASDAVTFLRRADERSGDVLGIQWLRTGNFYTPHLQLMSFESATIAM